VRGCAISQNGVLSRGQFKVVPLIVFEEGSAALYYKGMEKGQWNSPSDNQAT
jgi:hypothetical protein